MSRAQTLVLALLVLHVLLGVLCLVIAKGEHKSPALRWWGWGLVVYAAGLFVTILGNWLPRHFTLTLGNSLITLAAVLCATGVLSHTRYDLPRLPVDAAMLAIVALLAYANFADWHAALVNLVAPTAMGVAVFVVAGWKIWRQGPQDAHAASWFVAVCMFAAVATWILRLPIMGYEGGGRVDPQKVDFTISLFSIIQMINGVAATLALMWVDVRLMQADLSRVAHTDFLTGLPNRRSVMLRFREEIARAERAGGGFALAVLDIDRFKQINDRHGHNAGDAVLKQVARALDETKRAHDVLGRIGGEEFVLILPDQGREGALDAAERFRTAVARQAVVVAGGVTVRATISGGVAFYPGDGRDWDHVFAIADRRLYEAKRGGRDRIEAHA
ncbi:MAG: diguanylate cyclase [Betaproteobacteria bacterium]